MFDEELITWSVDGGGRPFYRTKHKFSVTNVCGYLRILARSKWIYRYIHAAMEYQHGRITFDWQMKAHPSVIRDLYKFACVPLGEQQRMANVLDAYEERVRAEKRQLSKLADLKRGLIDDLLTGRVRVSVTGEATP